MKAFLNIAGALLLVAAVGAVFIAVAFYGERSVLLAERAFSFAVTLALGGIVALSIGRVIELLQVIAERLDRLPRHSAAPKSAGVPFSSNNGDEQRDKWPK